MFVPCETSYNQIRSVFRRGWGVGSLQQVDGQIVPRNKCNLVGMICYLVERRYIAGSFYMSPYVCANKNSVFSWIVLFAPLFFC